MTHLTMEQLLALREPGLEPGVQGWRDHAMACELCRTELDRLDQRVARFGPCRPFHRPATGSPKCGPGPRRTGGAGARWCSRFPA